MQWGSVKIGEVGIVQVNKLDRQIKLANWFDSDRHKDSTHPRHATLVHAPSTLKCVATPTPQYRARRLDCAIVFLRKIIAAANCFDIKEQIEIKSR